MNTFKQTLLATVFVLGASGFASAADMSAPDAAPSEPSYSQPAPSNSGFYVRGDAGWSWIHERELGDSVVLGAGVGYRFNDMFRADVRFDYGFDYSVGPGFDYDIGSVLVNGYIDIPVGAFVTPYVGVGAGYLWVDPVGAGYTGAFSGALMAGVTFDVSESIALDIGYRFRHGFDSAVENFDDHSVQAGIRFSF